LLPVIAEAPVAPVHYRLSLSAYSRLKLAVGAEIEITY
jgi:hypothetical protein